MEAWSRPELDLLGEADADPRLAGDTAALAAALKRKYPARIVAEFTQPARPARTAPLPAGLDPRIAAALAGRGIRRLYSHQALALELALAGRHVVVATPTASGKSLCYHLPVLQGLLADGARALYLFPTKALAQDQVAELLELNKAGGLGARAMTFDGDTPADARKAVREQGDIVVSNPDMLHQGILPHHPRWAGFFETLRYVVIDELHGYRGVFGSHMANVIRRLKRISRFYGREPQFILCSATIANPKELAEALIGAPVEAVTESGAPQGPRTVLVWNPPVVNPDLNLRASARSQTARLARLAVKAGLSTIVFANARLTVEVLTKYLKDVFDRDPRRPARVAAYRGGYLPGERREKEKRMRAGSLDCVVTTSALELGVDIGALDVCLLNGYPGSIAATWQRLGRAGRRNKPSLGVLVAGSDLLDQFLARHPDFLFGASPEHARIDPDQLLILMDHLRCAAFELPFRAGEVFGPHSLQTLLGYLEEHGVVHREGDGWHWIADSYPAHAVSLRSVADGNFTVIDVTDGKQDILGEVDYGAAALTLYEGAIYLHQARPWQVERLDWTGRKAFVTRTRADYYTDAIDTTRLKVLDSFQQDRGAAATCAHGEVHVVRRVAGYKKIRYYSHENVGYGNVNLPDQEMHTTALWWSLDEAALERAFTSRQAALDGFLGAAHALHHVATLASMSELRDLGRAVGDGTAGWSAVTGADGRGSLRTLDGASLDPAAQRFRPTLTLYDNYPGGMGLAAPLFDRRSELVARAHDLVADCPCQSGCPACVGPVLGEAERFGLTAKQAALALLAMLAGGHQSNSEANPHGLH